MIKLPAYALGPRTPQRLKPRLSPIPYPHGAELAYVAPLVYVARSAARGTREKLIPKLDRFLAFAGKRHTPRVDDTNEELTKMIADLRSEYGVSSREARKIAIAMLDGVSTNQAARMVEQYNQVLSLNPLIGNEKWLPQAMDIATTENVALIKSIPSTMFDQVERTVRDGIMSGLRAEVMAQAIFERFGVSESRAMLIAQDQVGKWFGSLQRFRQLDAGVEEYEWSTSGDERVRPMHRALEGKIIRWDQPPIVDRRGRRAHAGMDIRCRCVAVPQIDLNEFDREEPRTPTPSLPPEQPVPRPRARPKRPAPAAPAPPSMAPPPPVVPRAPSVLPPAPVVPKAPSLPPPPATPGLPDYGVPSPVLQEAQAVVDRIVAKAKLLPVEAGGYAHVGDIDAVQDIADLQKVLMERLGLTGYPQLVANVRTFTSADHLSEGAFYPGFSEIALRVRTDYTPPLRVLLHETIHTVGGAATGGGYQRIGKFIEEAVTEELTQALLGNTWTPRSEDPAPAIDITGDFRTAYVRWRQTGYLYETEGNYKTYRNRIMSMLSTSMGTKDPEVVVMRARRAMVKWKQSEYRDPMTAQRAFIEALEPTSVDEELWFSQILSDHDAWDRHS